MTMLFDTDDVPAPLATPDQVRELVDRFFYRKETVEKWSHARAATELAACARAEARAAATALAKADSLAVADARAHAEDVKAGTAPEREPNPIALRAARLSLEESIADGSPDHLWFALWSALAVFSGEDLRTFAHLIVCHLRAAEDALS